MQHTVAVCVIECVGESAAEPCHRFRPGQRRNFGSNSRIGRPNLALVRQRLIHHVEQQLAAALVRRSLSGRFDDAEQRPARQILHVEQPQRAAFEESLVEDANDVVVIELGERLRLRPVILGDLDRDQPLHRPLPGQEHPGERAAPEFGHQVEIVDPLTRVQLHQGGCTAGVGQQSRLLLAGRQHVAELFCLIRVLLGVLVGVGSGPAFASNVEFLVDQIRW